MRPSFLMVKIDFPLEFIKTLEEPLLVSILFHKDIFLGFLVALWR